MEKTDQKQIMDVALFEPEIPPNTGNIIRLCANTGTQLHLIEPLKFDINDKTLRRAGLDYHEYTSVKHYKNYSKFEKTMHNQRIFACSTKGKTWYHEVTYNAGDILLFGPETRGLPQQLLDRMPSGHIIRIPMLPTSRSLNLSNAVAIILMEALRQLAFPNAC